MSVGYEFFLKRLVAEGAATRGKARMWQAELKEYEVDTSKQEIWKALNELGGHPDKWIMHGSLL